MKYMILIKATADTEAGVMPKPEVFEGMARYNEALIQAGVLVSAEGLQESRKGARVKYSKGQVTVTDGPFAETKELISGFWILDVKSKDEAIEWVKRMTQEVQFEEGEEVEIRKVWEASDWADEGMPADKIEREEQLRAEAEAKQR